MAQRGSTSRKGNKQYLATKICVSCKKEIVRRKKRERCREEIEYCSASCKKLAKAKKI